MIRSVLDTERNVAHLRAVLRLIKWVDGDGMEVDPVADLMDKRTSGAGHLDLERLRLSEFSAQ